MQVTRDEPDIFKVTPDELIRFVSDRCYSEKPYLCSWEALMRALGLNQDGTIAAETLSKLIPQESVQSIDAARAIYRSASSKHFGTNELPQTKTRSFIEICLECGKDRTLLLLALAGAVSLSVGCYKVFSENDNLAWVEGAAIITAVFVIVLVSAVSEYSQELMFMGFRKSGNVSECKIASDGDLKTICSDLLSVGDILFLETGDVVHADALLFAENECSVDESTLTGESGAVRKFFKPPRGSGHENFSSSPSIDGLNSPDSFPENEPPGYVRKSITSAKSGHRNSGSWPPHSACSSSTILKDPAIDENRERSQRGIMSDLTSQDKRCVDAPIYQASTPEANYSSSQVCSNFLKTDVITNDKSLRIGNDCQSISKDPSALIGAYMTADPDSSRQEAELPIFATARIDKISLQKKGTIPIQRAVALSHSQATNPMNNYFFGSRKSTDPDENPQLLLETHRMGQNYPTGKAKYSSHHLENAFLLAGTHVIQGSARAVVIATGKNTQHGAHLQKVDGTRCKTPLEKKISHLTSVLAGRAAALSLALFLAQTIVLLIRRAGFRAFLNAAIESISIVVVAVPEGVPLALAIAFCFGTRRMLNDGLLVRHLPATEAMHSVSVIATDKTGTLTCNRMEARKVYKDDSVRIGKIGAFNPMFTLNMCLNSSCFESKGIFVGSQTESACLRMLIENGIDYRALRSRIPVLKCMPFASDQKFSATFVRLDFEAMSYFFPEGVTWPPYLELSLKRTKQPRIANCLIENRDFEQAKARISSQYVSMKRALPDMGANQTYGNMKLDPVQLQALDPKKASFSESQLGNDQMMSSPPEGTYFTQTNPKSAHHSAVKSDSDDLFLLHNSEDVCSENQNQHSEYPTDFENVVQNTSAPCESFNPSYLSVNLSESDDKTICNTNRKNLKHPRYVALYKGAPERILASCSSLMLNGHLQELNHQKIENFLAQCDSEHLRTIAFAFAPLESPDNDCLDLPTSDLIFSGIVALADPLRPDVSEKIALCKRSGIIVTMLTGDKPDMARAVATRVGILEPGQLCIEGEAFRYMDQKTLYRDLLRIRVIARCSPLDKQKYVELMQAAGCIVAVTGDGTNDGPALKTANIGLGMGISGTEIAKAASSIILTNDNFSAITKCIEWGRCINGSVRKFIQFQLSVTYSTILIATATSLVKKNSSALFTPVFMIWINLIVDTLAVLALSTDTPNNSFTMRKPEHIETPVVTRSMRTFIVYTAIYQTFITLILYYTLMDQNTFVLNVYTYMLTANMINARCLTKKCSIFSGMAKNKMLWFVIVLILTLQMGITQKFNILFKTTTLNFGEFMLSAGIGISIIPYYQIVRFVQHKCFASRQRDWKTLHNNLKFHIQLTDHIIERCI